jgi:N-methylhydantoinase B
MANNVIAKMLLCAGDKELRQQVMGPPPAQGPLIIAEGTDKNGEYFVAPFAEQIIGVTGPTPYKDGNFADAPTWIPEGRGANVELIERKWPFLMLYRREHQDTAGVGKFRSGNGGQEALIPHKGQININTYFASGVPKTGSIFGGYPGSREDTIVYHDSDLLDLIDEGQLPSDINDLDGNERRTVGKGEPFSLPDDSALEWWWGSSSGLGDPLDRNPEHVSEDVIEGSVSKKTAKEMYGVVCDSDGIINHKATDSLREEMLNSRLNNAIPVEEYKKQNDIEVRTGGE